jgi:hypothetical protein
MHGLLPILTWDQKVAYSVLISILNPCPHAATSTVIFGFNCLPEIKHIRQPHALSPTPVLARTTWPGVASTYSAPR